MNIEVRVITNAKKREIKKENNYFKVRLTSQPIEGKANKELTDFLSEVFCIKKSDIKIIRGEKDKIKIISLPDIKM
ncbi:MAG: DUF167 domain-containing protein [Syntrophorhabdaceae bacterium]|jgi:uncharacterized protein (TIGR00251 family)|nr:DUF167 domain-containing protein [Syntrophorhabdaceae bacterium]